MERGPRLRTACVIVAAVTVLAVASCASITYTRDYTYVHDDKNVDVSETLVLSGDTFRLEKKSNAGVAVYEGKFREQRDTWRFELGYNKPANGPGRVIDPPMVYEYEARTNPDGVTLTGPDVKSRGQAIPFIMKGSYVRIRSQ